MSAKSAGQRPETNAAPLIPDEYLDVPSQRLYAVSIGILCQVCLGLLSWNVSYNGIGGQTL